MEEMNGKIEARLRALNNSMGDILAEYSRQEVMFEMLVDICEKLDIPLNEWGEKEKKKMADTREWLRELRAVKEKNGTITEFDRLIYGW